jgi:hypothetical protein
VIIERTVTIADPLARANVFGAFSGPGRPTGVTRCDIHGDDLVVTYDDDISSAQLIDDLIVIESTFVPERSATDADADAIAAGAARGLGDPQIDASRIIETYLP